MIFLKSALPTMDLTNKRVLLRVDANVPLDNGAIIDDYRLQEIIPTINLIQKKGGKIILATHIGRPNKPDPALSTTHLMPWFINHGYSIVHEPDLARAQQLSHQDPRTILLLENLRFYEGEKQHDESFARQLATLADIYVNDAFGLVHRDDTSITLVPRYFSPEHKTIGLLIERELAMLNKLVDHPRKPFALVLGGGKVAEKIPLLNSLASHLDMLLLCPAPVFTFMHAQGKPVGTSLVDPAHTKFCLDFLKRKSPAILMPSDYLIGEKDFHGKLSQCNAENFPENGFGISIGHKTEKEYTHEIAHAGTILFNGIPGDSARPETLHGAHALLAAAAHNKKAISIVCGGDSVAIARQLGFADKLTYLSTGGGASLAYISGEVLPGLEPFAQQG